VKVLEKSGKNLYQCEICSMKYEEKEYAEKCEKWCGENKSCNLDIIKYAIEENE
jgi:hypothetical protein